jgi:hypothetical protein
MVITDTLKSLSLIIEIQNGVNGKGEAIFKKRTFSGIRLDAPYENIYNVAEAISEILETETGEFLLNKIISIEKTPDEE